MVGAVDRLGTADMLGMSESLGLGGALGDAEIPGRPDKAMPTPVTSPIARTTAAASRRPTERMWFASYGTGTRTQPLASGGLTSHIRRLS
jgi:hypothetical protein